MWGAAQLHFSMLVSAFCRPLTFRDSLVSHIHIGSRPLFLPVEFARTIPCAQHLQYTRKNFQHQNIRTSCQTQAQKAPLSPCADESLLNSLLAGVRRWASADEPLLPCADESLLACAEESHLACADESLREQ